MVEEADAGRNLGAARAVEVQLDGDLGLLGGAGDLARAHRELLEIAPPSTSKPSPAPQAAAAGSGYGLRNAREHLDKRMPEQLMSNPEVFHGTTILAVRKGDKVAIGGDGQVSFGATVVKANAKKVRRLGDGDVIGGFAGATADALTLFDRLEQKLEQHKGQLARACVELAKDWRTDRYLRRLDAMMLVADKDVTLLLAGTGDVLEPESGVAGIGSGGPYALAAAARSRRQPQLRGDRAPLARNRGRDLCLYQPQSSRGDDRKVTVNVSLRNPNMQSLTPREIVSELDRYIVGQNDAKRAVAIALAQPLAAAAARDKLREEVLPKNILMIGPTGVGKTEISRRLAKLARRRS